MSRRAKRQDQGIWQPCMVEHAIFSVFFLFILSFLARRNLGVSFPKIIFFPSWYIFALRFFFSLAIISRAIISSFPREPAEINNWWTAGNDVDIIGEKRQRFSRHVKTWAFRRWVENVSSIYTRLQSGGTGVVAKTTTGIVFVERGGQKKCRSTGRVYSLWRQREIEPRSCGFCIPFCRRRLKIHFLFTSLPVKTTRTRFDSFSFSPSLLAIPRVRIHLSLSSLSIHWVLSSNSSLSRLVSCGSFEGGLQWKPVGKKNTMRR